MENYSTADGQIELDLLGEKNNTSYIFEIKWKNKAASYKDLKKFVEKNRESKVLSEKEENVLCFQIGF